MGEGRSSGSLTVQALPSSGRFSVQGPFNRRRNTGDPRESVREHTVNVVIPGEPSAPTMSWRSPESSNDSFFIKTNPSAPNMNGDFACGMLLVAIAT